MQQDHLPSVSVTPSVLLASGDIHNGGIGGGIQQDLLLPFSSVTSSVLLASGDVTNGGSGGGL